MSTNHISNRLTVPPNRITTPLHEGTSIEFCCVSGDVDNSKIIVNRRLRMQPQRYPVAPIRHASRVTAPSVMNIGRNEGVDRVYREQLSNMKWRMYIATYIYIYQTPPTCEVQPTGLNPYAVPREHFLVSSVEKLLV